MTLKLFIVKLKTMMSSVQRFVITCLLLLALPMQSFAAVVACACADDHHSSHTQTHKIQEQSAEHLHDEPQALAHVHHDETHAHTKHVSHMCAPCCTGAALVSFASNYVVVSRHEVNFPALVLGQRFLRINHFERPPRILLS